MSKLYGIKNCDTIKKARNWLEQNAIPYQFIDYRTDGITEQQLVDFAAECGWENMLNTRGTTFRQLPESDKSNLTQAKAIGLMLAQPAMIKRPLLIHNDTYYLGFKAEEYQRIFGASI
jgi:arsenate reductase (glutaredoxin)